MGSNNAGTFGRRYRNLVKSRGRKRRFWNTKNRPRGGRVMQPGVFMVILFTGVRSIYLDNIPLVIWNMRVRLILEPLRCLLSQLRAKQRGPIWKRQGQPGLCSLSALQQGVGGGTRTHGRINNATRTQRHGADLRVNEESETNGGKRMVIQVVKQERRRRKRM